MLGHPVKTNPRYGIEARDGVDWLYVFQEIAYEDSDSKVQSKAIMVPVVPLGDISALNFLQLDETVDTPHAVPVLVRNDYYGFGHPALDVLTWVSENATGPWRFTVMDLVHQPVLPSGARRLPPRLYTALSVAFSAAADAVMCQMRFSDNLG
jgi:hypothetical protein